MKYLLFLVLVIFLASCAADSHIDSGDEIFEKNQRDQELTSDEEQIRDFLTGEELSVEDCPSASSPDGCYQRVALQKEDYTICENVMNYRLGCYEAIARKLQDPSICDEYVKEKDEDDEFHNIEEQGRRQLCRDIVESTMVEDTELETTRGSVEECENLVDQDSMIAASCYSRAAMEQQDYTLCDRINPEGITGSTRTQCFQQLAIALQNPYVCNEITNPNEQMQEAMRETCKSMIR